MAMKAQVRSANILYDRDSHGEFFQLYSRGWGNGLFFEIVERRKGYRGYAAANAPFRMAALRRAMGLADCHSFRPNSTNSPLER